MDGVSLCPLLEDPEAPGHAAISYTKARTIRTDTHRLIAHPNGHLELYDLNKDPNQFTNVAGDPEYDAVLKKLNAQLMDFLLDHNDFCLHEPPNSDWQKETRKQVIAHCERVGRPVPAVDGD